MQASKIVIGKTYAIRDDDSQLVRFVATAVVTRRKSAHNNPHDYESTIEGYITAQDRKNEKDQNLTLDPKWVLGPYEEQAELVARKAAEQAAYQAEKDAYKAAGEKLYRMLYNKADLPVPNDGRDHKSPFRISYSGDTLELNREGVALLLKILEEPK